MKKKFASFGIIIILIVVVFTAEIILYSSSKNRNKYKPKKNDLKVSSDLYKVDKDILDYYNLGEFKTKLPVIFINTDGNQIVKEGRVWSNMGVLSNEDGIEEKIITEGPDIDFPITIKLRGASSYSGFDKNQYRIELYKEKGKSNSLNYSFLGMDKHSKWILNGPFLDTTMMRNHLIYKLSREIFDWAPDTKFCELFLDGKYQGIYVATEAIENDKNRLDLKEFGLLTGETAYIVKRDRVGTDKNPIVTYGELEGKTFNNLYISYPGNSKITKAQINWIKEDISKFEKALYSEDFADSEKGYLKYIDVDNFVDYFILNEVVMNRDAGNLSTYAYKDLSGKIKLTVWDFNNAYDNYQWFKSDYSEFRMLENSWFDRILKDRNFVDKVIVRYDELRKTTLDEEYMYRNIEMFQSETKNAVERNFLVWGYMFDKEMMNDPDRMITSYDEGINQLKSAIYKRFLFLDSHIEDLYKNCIN